ncbi:MAG TPA: class I SAM-dependent methyltransferase [Bacteroidota bacterium]|nr:class I SAM-dependent methyltransferase [Bacteroidota bacterium]
MAQDLPPCPVCGNARVRAMPFRYVHGGRELRALGCRRCGIIFLHPQPTAEELKRLYSSEYFDGGDFRCGHEGGYCEPETLERLADPQLLMHIRDIHAGRRFLEIGCAAGAFLDAARRLGFTVQGVELSEEASRKAREQFGLPVFTGQLADAGFAAGSFDVVFMGDVLEHLPDPVGALSEIHRILAPGGLVVIGVPSQTNTLFSRLGFILYGMLGKQTTVSLPPYHLFEYRPGSLRRLLARCGFTVAEIRQGMIPPGAVHLRGPALERVGKKAFQYPNWLLTRLLGACGDRIEAYALKGKGRAL